MTEDAGLMTENRTNKNKIIFLDRDGVINRYPGDRNYVTCLKEFRFLPGSLKAIRLLTEAGYHLYVVSNQGGVFKGLYSRETLQEMTQYMQDHVRKQKGKIQDVLYCLHPPDANCICRKPKDGLLRKAVCGRKIDRKETYFIGDGLMDMKAGKSFGCKTILVLSGREKLKNALSWDVLPDFIAKNLLDAAQHILRHQYERA